MTVARMLLELTVLFIVIVGLLSVVGFGPVKLLVPDIGGVELLLCPGVGLAVLYLACQAFSPWLPSSTIVVGTCLATGVLSVAMVAAGWGRWRGRLGGLRPHLLIALPLAAVASLIVQLPMLRAGVFTLANSGGDDLFTWAPTADYMRDHAFSLGHPTAYTSPLLWVLSANTYPGSAGTVDGGLSAVLRRDGYQLVEPLTAVCLGLAVVGVYTMVTAGMGHPRRVASLAAAIAAISPFHFVIAGYGFAQSSRGAVVLLAAIATLMLAIRTRSSRCGLLAGAVAAVLSATYMPLFVVCIAAIVGGCLAVVATSVARRRWPEAWRPLAGLTVGGFVLGALNVKWLLFDGGLGQWATFSRQFKDFANGGGAYPIHFLLGAAPDERVFGSSPPLFWNSAWSAASTVVALTMLALMAVGAVSLLRARRSFELCCLLGALAYGVLVISLARDGFGAFQTAAYVSPFVAILLAMATSGIVSGRPPHQGSGTAKASRARSGRVIRAASITAIIPILALQMGASAETAALGLRQPPLLPPASLALRTLSSIIPPGSSVLLFSANGSTQNSTFVKSTILTAAALFLPDRSIVLEGRPFGSVAIEPADAQEVTTAMAAGYTYILRLVDPTIADAQVPATYRPVWAYQPYDLVLYRRLAG